MKEWVIIQEAKEEGEEIGIPKGRDIERFEAISNMLRNNKTPEQISEFCGYSLEEVRRVQQKMLTEA